MPDDEDRLRDASSGAGAGWAPGADGDTSWAEAEAPDDISALAKDIAAYQRERRTARRNAALDRYVSRPGAPALSLLIGVLAVASIVAIVMIVTRPNHAKALIPPADLASPTVAIGHEGGLLPEVTLTAADGTTRASRALRPGIVVVMPPQCGCEGTVVRLAEKTAEVSDGQLRVFAISPTAGGAQADALAGLLPARSAVYDDPKSEVASGIGSNGLTAVVVRPDGTIAKVLPGLTATTTDRLHDPLVALLQPQTAG